MTEPRPWELGDHAARWNGYLLAPGSSVLRNKVGATTPEDLCSAENDLLEFRLAELRSQPRLVARTYDLAHLRSLHLHLFQDIYEWAGDLRTVAIAKGEGEDTSFVPPMDIERPVARILRPTVGRVRPWSRMEPGRHGGAALRVPCRPRARRHLEAPVNHRARAGR